MNRKDLLTWFRSKKWYEQLFLFILLIRPVVEPFFYLKNSSPLLSPLYWIAFLSFFICIKGISSNLKYKSPFDMHFGIWTVLALLNIFCLFFSYELLEYVAAGLRLINPILIFYFLRGLIKNKSDLYGLLTIFLLSCGIACLWFMFDLSSSGFNLRDKSSFADVVNYGLYANIALIIAFYFYLKKQVSFTEFWKPKLYLIVGIVLLTILTHFAIKHLSSIAVSAIVVCLYVFYLSRKKIGSFVLVLGVIVTLLLSIGEQFYDSVINERIQYELEVVEGSRAKTQALHGRVNRWEWLSKDFFSGTYYGQFFGYPLNMKYSDHMVGITPHNDFLRILFFTGFVGLFFYLRFLVLSFIKVRKMLLPDKFLAYASLLTLVLYSVSTVPTFYQGFNNFIFGILAFIALPKQVLDEEI